MTTIMGSPVADRTARPSAPPCKDAAKEDPGRQSTGDQEDRGEHRHEQQHIGPWMSAPQVEVDAALDEEDRDEEAEPDRLELALDRLGCPPP